MIRTRLFIATSTVVLICSAMGSLAKAEIYNFGIGGNQFAVEFVTVNNAGNLPDGTGDPNPSGAVPYEYRIAKFEISRDMITKANAAGGVGITLFDMTFFGGNGPDRPATGITWFEAAKFANWLNTSSGFSPAYKFDGSGNFQLWSPQDSGFDSANRFRNTRARYVIPTTDEWYKAAYHDASAGTAGVYFDYPTASDTVPATVVAGTTENTAVFSGQPAPADVQQAGGLSSYGTMGQGGNAFEWVETESDLLNDSPLSNRDFRGGSFASLFRNLASDRRSSSHPDDLGNSINSGFRIARVTDPADLNGDSSIDGADVGIIFANWGGSGLGDVVNDGLVDGADLGVLYSNWTGDTFLVTSVPEPIGFSWTGGGLFIAAQAKRRGASKQEVFGRYS